MSSEQERLEALLAESSSGLLGSPVKTKRRSAPRAAPDALPTPPRAASPPPYARRPAQPPTAHQRAAPPDARPPPPPPPPPRTIVAGADAPRPAALRVHCATFNVGNMKLVEGELGRWLPGAEGDADVVVVGLQESRYLSETQRRSLKVVVGATAIGAVGGAGVGAAAGAVLGAGAAGVMAVRANVAGTTKMRESHLWKTVKAYLDKRGFGAALRLEWGQMRLLVFGSRATVADVTVEREVVSRVGGYVNVDVSGGWLGNKGGLAARLLVEPRAPATPRRNGSFSSLGCSGLREGRTDALDAHLGAVFDRARDHAAAGGAAPTVALGLLSVHLPAHEGRAEDRADAFRRIMDDCGEALAGADAQLLLGDFNARLGGGRSREVVLDAVNRAVAGDGAALALLYRRDDELVAALARAAYARDDALRGLATPDCDFAPTFKVARGLRGCAYSPKRLPSWTDRVLYRASQRAPGVRCDLDVERYAACPDVSSSDHKPVVLVATVRLAAGS